MPQNWKGHRHWLFWCEPQNKKAILLLRLCQPRARKQQQDYFRPSTAKTSVRSRMQSLQSRGDEVAWKESEEGKAKIKEYTSSEKYLERCEKFSKTDAGKKIRKKTYAKHKLSNDLLCASNRIPSRRQLPQVSEGDVLSVGRTPAFSVQVCAFWFYC